MAAQLKTALRDHCSAELCCLLALTFLQRLSTETLLASSPPSPVDRCLDPCEAGPRKGWLGISTSGKSLWSKLSKTRLGPGVWSWPAEEVIKSQTLWARPDLRGSLISKGRPVSLAGQDKPSGQAAPREEAQPKQWDHILTESRGVAQMQIKTTMWYHFTSTRMVIMKKSNNKKKNRTPENKT